jgi:hypothetical protein
MEISGKLVMEYRNIGAIAPSHKADRLSFAMGPEEPRDLRTGYRRLSVDKEIEYSGSTLGGDGLIPPYTDSICFLQFAVCPVTEYGSDTGSYAHDIRSGMKPSETVDSFHKQFYKVHRTQRQHIEKALDRTCFSLQTGPCRRRLPAVVTLRGRSHGWRDLV